MSIEQRLTAVETAASDLQCRLANIPPSPNWLEQITGSLNYKNDRYRNRKVSFAQLALVIEKLKVFNSLLNVIHFSHVSLNFVDSVLQAADFGDFFYLALAPKPAAKLKTGQVTLFSEDKRRSNSAHNG
jgi:hypothetical protein